MPSCKQYHIIVVTPNDFCSLEQEVTAPKSNEWVSPGGYNRYHRPYVSLPMVSISINMVSLEGVIM